MTRSGVSAQLVAALRSLSAFDWSPDADLLVEAIIERRHVTSALKILELIPENSVNLDALIQLITRHGSPEKLLEAVRLTSERPRVQQNLLPILTRTAPVKHLIEAYQYIPKNSPLLEGLLELILEKVRSTMDLMPLIRSTEDVTSETFFKLIRRFIKGAPVKELVKLLEIQVSDMTEMGEFIVTEIVARGKPDHMFEAYEFVGMDSFASVALACAMSRYAPSEAIDAALEQSSALPRAAIVLRHTQLKQLVSEGEQQGFVAKILGKSNEKEARQAELKKIEQDAKRLITETEERLYRISEKVHGAATGRLKRH